MNESAFVFVHFVHTSSKKDGVLYIIYSSKNSMHSRHALNNA